MTGNRAGAGRLSISGVCASKDPDRQAMNANPPSANATTYRKLKLMIDPNVKGWRHNCQHRYS